MNSMSLRPAAVLALAALAAALPAHAEPLYRSAFDTVRPHADPRPIEWRSANDQMATLGGHAGHLRAPAGSGPSADGIPHSGHDHGPASGTQPQAPAPSAAPSRPAERHEHEHEHGAGGSPHDSGMPACPMHARMHGGAAAHAGPHAGAMPMACHGADMHPGGAQ